MKAVSLIIVFATFLLSCSIPEEWRDETFTDLRDGKVYKIIAIGTQTWMAENLNYDVSGSRCYKDDPVNCEKYGRLYNWKMAMTVCPEGWYLPTDAEWAKLNIKVPDDNYVFPALPGGYYDSYSISGYLGDISLWWTAIDGGNSGSSANVCGIIDYIFQTDMDKSSLVSVRCLKGEPSFNNNSSNSNSNSSNIIYSYDLIDERDPQKPMTYKTVVIGEQTWMAENLNYYVLGSRCYNNYPGNCERYGRLYNWEMAMTVCPDGWHLPNNMEWAALENFAGSDPGTKLKATNGWNWNDWDNISGNGTDDYGFSALPYGPGGPDGDFSYGGNLAYWWGSARRDDDYQWNAYTWGLTYKDANMDIRKIGHYEFQSVRCIKE